MTPEATAQALWSSAGAGNASQSGRHDSSAVIAGLDPAIHLLRNKSLRGMDGPPNSGSSGGAGSRRSSAFRTARSPLQRARPHVAAEAAKSGAPGSEPGALSLRAICARHFELHLTMPAARQPKSKPT